MQENHNNILSSRYRQIAAQLAGIDVVGVPRPHESFDEGSVHCYTRVKSMIQLVSQLLPSSSEKACSQRADLSVMRDHR